MLPAICILTADMSGYLFNYIMLGQAVALRFLEWVWLNPGGVVALPTGKTPEFFIKWVQFYLENWEKEAKTGLLAEAGFNAKQKPDLHSLVFVMLDEFFPIDPEHERSFRHFVSEYYIKGFGIDESKALLFNTYIIDEVWHKLTGNYKNLQDIFPDGLIDLSLRIKHPQTMMEEVQKKTIKLFDQICEDYEERIRRLGGIGFFLGGIGPDGHIAFNVKGSSHHSHTRLTNINYETQAAAAVDLGGIESVRKKAVVTIGLETITYNPDTVAVIMAAGESKSQVIAGAVENSPALEYPGSALQKLKHARFYLTQGAASKLAERQRQTILATKIADDTLADKLVIDGALLRETSLMEIANAKKQFDVHNTSSWILAEKITGEKLPVLAQKAFQRLTEKIEKGINLPRNKRFLHTGPHHDDIELAYFPLLHHLVRSEFNENHFVYCTSGFTSVTNDYVKQCLNALLKLLKTRNLYEHISKENLLDRKLSWDDITGTLNSIAEQNREKQQVYLSSRLARLLFHHLNIQQTAGLITFVENQINYLIETDPGKKEPEVLQNIKGWIREFEAELVWAHFGIDIDHVSHLRLKFYAGDIFDQYPDIKRDVEPVVELLDRVRPSIISIALDPEGSGPDTHFKTLIALAYAIDIYVEKHKDKNIRIWGYRNIWSRFHAADASMIVPVSLNSFAVLHNMFNNCFLSQKSASFPSYEYEGPFSEMAQKIWVKQHSNLITLLGNDYFYDNPNPMMRRSYGAIYIQDMSYPEFSEKINFLRNMMNAKKNLKEI